MGFDLGIKNSVFLESDYNHNFEFLHFGVFEVDIEGTCYPLDFYCKLALCVLILYSGKFGKRWIV